MLNKNYMHYNPSVGTGPYGVTIRFLKSNPDSWGFFCGTPCHKGWADCRVSASILNQKVMVVNNRVEAALDDPIGMVFNQTAIETKLGKCYYSYDGGTDLRYNFGCGCGSASTNCSDPQCAYNMIDPKTGKKMTPNSTEISRCHCSSPNDAQNCGYFKGPAFFPDAGANELNDMLQQRIRLQAGGIQKLDWDEVIIDGRLLNDMLLNDPESAISAFVWIKTGGSTDASNKATAQKLSQSFNEKYKFQRTTVIALSTQQDVYQGGPFQLA